MSDRRQRQKEMRAAKREAERKKEARQELIRRLITALVFGVVVVAIFTFGAFSAMTTERASRRLTRTTALRKRLVTQTSRPLNR